MVIDNLANQSQYLETLTNWHHQEWSHLTLDLSIEQRRKDLIEHLNGASLPVTFIALENHGLIGGICLVEHDLESKPGYTPWLSRIFVTETARGQAVATQLINHAKDYIQDIGFEKLYLLTEYRQDYFVRFGWREIEMTTLYSHQISIMKLDLINK